jgi:hypothetical protein
MGKLLPNLLMPSKKLAHFQHGVNLTVLVLLLPDCFFAEETLIWAVNFGEDRRFLQQRKK